MLILSVIKANDNANIDLCDKRTAFVISTTKGNVSYLSEIIMMTRYFYGILPKWYADFSETATNRL